jgi:hypothetical protein
MRRKVLFGCAWPLRQIEGVLFWHVGKLLSDWFGERARYLEDKAEE